jgi:hypothetical protein
MSKPAVAATASTAAVPTPAATAPAVAVPAAPVAAGLPIRIKAGATAPYTDSSGNVWLPDQGFVDGDVVDRDNDAQIANTQDRLFIAPSDTA